MKNLIILCAGGYGREICLFAQNSIGYSEEYILKGFLDDDIHKLDSFNGYPPIIDTIMDYKISKDDVFVCALGDVKIKKKVINTILSKGGEFITLISKDAYIGQNVEMGKGCIICPTARIHCDVRMGDFVTLQPFSVLGHDVQIGNWSHVNNYADCGGASVIGNEVIINTHSFILPLVTIGDGAAIGAGSIVLRNVPSGIVMFGNPAKPLPLPGNK